VLVIGFAVGHRSSAARAAHREALALRSLGPLRSSAARAAHREALALGSLAPMRSSAARAALRGASPLPHLLQRAMAWEAIVASLVGMTQFFGWRCCRLTCLQSCAKADNHGLTGMARCNKCRSGLARDAPRGRRSVSRALKILRQAPRGRRSISQAQKILRRPHIRSSYLLRRKGKNDRGDRHKPAARFHGKCSGTSRG